MSLKRIFKKTWRETKDCLVFSKFICFLINLNMQDKNEHHKVGKYIKVLMKINNPFAYFYLAELNFFYAKYVESLGFIDVFLKKFANHADGVILKSQILYCLGNKEQAWTVLEDLLQVCYRGKIWLALGKIVENSSDFARMEKLYFKINRLQNKQIVTYLINAANKAKVYEKSKKYLQEMILGDNGNNKNKIHKKNFNEGDAEKALKDISDFFKKYNIKIFLVSGTFLGCVREGKILSHDYDIDIGVFEEDIKCDIAKLICKEGVFCIHEFNTPGIFKVKHINGILIDIFIHYREGKKVYHLGAKAKWFNTEFSLKEYLFLNQIFLGAENADLYLSENYGIDWKEPKSIFDSVLDTPNAVITNQEEFVIHLYKLLMSRYSLSQQQRILNELVTYGEGNFVEKYAKSNKI